jgi:hypothetical protein
MGALGESDQRNPELVFPVDEPGGTTGLVRRSPDEIANDDRGVDPDHA